jgi:hypothetical protein
MVSTELINAKDSSRLGCSSWRIIAAGWFAETVPADLNDRSAIFKVKQSTNLNVSVCLFLCMTLTVMSNNFQATNYVHIEFPPSSIMQDAMKTYGKIKVYATHSLNLALATSSMARTSSKYAHKHATRFYNY